MGSGRLRNLAIGLLWFAPLAASPKPAPTLAPAPAVHEVDWRTSPMDLNLRGYNGARFRFQCPPGRVAPGQVTGSGPYTDSSSICAAGVHAGVIAPASGGVVTIEVRPGEAQYRATRRHYVQSNQYDGFWIGSFLVIPGSPASHLP